MNISAKEIVHLMEKRVALVYEQIDRGDEQAIRDSATAIEAYCQLLKNGRVQDGHKKEKKQLHKKQSGLIAKPTSTSTQVKKDRSLGNLLDF